MIQPSFTRSKWVHWESVVRAQKQKISPILIILNAKNVVLQSWNFKFLQKSVARTDYIFGKIKLWSLFFCTIFLDGTGCQVIYHPCLWEKATLWGTDKKTDVWSRPSCIYTQIFSSKKTIFFQFFGVKQFLNSCLWKRYYATFQCGCQSVF